MWKDAQLHRKGQFTCKIPFTVLKVNYMYIRCLSTSRLDDLERQTENISWNCNFNLGGGNINLAATSELRSKDTFL